jgi:hypothetical protein
MANEENLKSWSKGESGNPKGRPKGSKNRSTILRELTELRVKDVHPVTGEEVWVTNEYRMAMAVIDKAIAKGDHQALNMIYDNIYGKQKDSVDMTTTETVSHDFKKLVSAIKFK